MKLTGTNRPITYTTHQCVNGIQKTFTPSTGKKITRLLASTMWFPTNKPRFDGRNQQLNNNTTVVTPDFPPHAPGRRGCGARVTAVIAWGKRPVPFRTRKLRPTAPMVLHPGGCGRVGHRRNIIHGQAPTHTCRGLTHLKPTPNHNALAHPTPIPPTLWHYPHQFPRRSGTTRRSTPPAAVVPPQKNCRASHQTARQLPERPPNRRINQTAHQLRERPPKRRIN